MKKSELQVELKRVTARSDAHFQNYIEMMRRVDVLAVELREAREALRQIADCNRQGQFAELLNHWEMRHIAREALK